MNENAKNEIKCKKMKEHEKNRKKMKKNERI